MCLSKSFPPFLRKLCLPISQSYFIFFYLLSFLSSITWCYNDKHLLPVIFVLCLSGVAAYLESLVVWALRKVKPVQLAITALIVIIHDLLILTDYYLIIKFRMVITSYVIDILAETNSAEISNFFHAYLPWYIIVLAISLLLLFTYLLWVVSKRIAKLPYRLPAAVLTVCGFGIYIYMVWGYVFYRDGMGIPQCNSLTRVGYMSYIAKQNEKKVVFIYDACKNVKATQDYKDKPWIIVIIGESYSVYHSQAYGYNRPTTPNLERLKEEGNLFVFDDVATVSNFTHGAMTSVFSLDSLGVDFINTPLFPSFFKAVGYKTAMYDNQYFAGQGVNFLSDESLSHLLFDYRNTKRFRHDNEMIKTLTLNNEPSLYVIHLWGQHFNYEERYPSKFAYFKPSDYSDK